jgi:hypothetical protein
MHTMADLQCEARTRESARERERERERKGRIAANGGGQVRDFVAGGGGREEKESKLEMTEGSSLSLP